MLPIELLKTELKLLERARYKSTLSCIMGDIRIKTHSIHLKNLIPKIEIYEREIKRLQNENEVKKWI